MTSLDITVRDGSVTAEALRASGKVPAVFYGPKEEAVSIAFDKLAFDKVFKEAGESTVITLKGLGEDKDTLIHDIDFHPVTGMPVHVDFYVMEKGKKVRTHVPLEFIGEEEALAIKSLGGTLVKTIHEIEIEAMPKDLPHGIEIDVSILDTFDKHIAIKDIKLPAGVEIVDMNPDDAVASVAEPREEVIDEPVVAIDMDAIEVEKKGKTEEEGEAAAAEGEGESK
jgi:large subunit ribosomal protein L25